MSIKKSSPDKSDELVEYYKINFLSALNLTYLFRLREKELAPYIVV